MYKEWVLSVPYKVKVTKEKFFYLNLNVYRNAHFHTLNKAKVEFDKLLEHQLANLPKMQQVRISYILYAASARECDTANICCIINKFVCDSLVKAQVIPDDNYKIVLNTIDGFGGIDKSNPRVEVVIEQIN